MFSLEEEFVESLSSPELVKYIRKCKDSLKLDKIFWKYNLKTYRLSQNIVDAVVAIIKNKHTDSKIIYHLLSLEDTTTWTKEIIKSFKKGIPDDMLYIIVGKIDRLDTHYSRQLACLVETEKTLRKLITKIRYHDTKTTALLLTNPHLTENAITLIDETCKPDLLCKMMILNHPLCPRSLIVKYAKSNVPAIKHRTSELLNL